MATYTTFSGLAAKEIPVRLAEIFSDTRAYKGVPGGADLTDIDTGFMLERITEVFGPKGLGWNLVFQPENMEILWPSSGGSNLRDKVMARLKYAEFKYAVFDGGQATWIEIPTSGASINELAYAEEGARTSALGSAVKGLCFQLPVYKGIVDHHNAAAEIKKEGKSATPPPSAGKPAANVPTAGGKTKQPPAAPAAPAADIPAKPGESPASQAVAGALLDPAPQPKAPVSKEAAPPAETPVAAVEDPGDYVIPIGVKHKGKRIRDLSAEALEWYAKLDAATPIAREIQAKARVYQAKKTA